MRFFDLSASCSSPFAASELAAEVGEVESLPEPESLSSALRFFEDEAVEASVGSEEAVEEEEVVEDAAEEAALELELEVELEVEVEEEEEEDEEAAASCIFLNCSKNEPVVWAEGGWQMSATA